MRYNLSEIMRKAWTLRKRHANRFPTMSAALTAAWARAKRDIEIDGIRSRYVIAEAAPSDSVVDRLVSIGGRVWENYGKRRVYLNSSCVISLCSSLSRIEYNEISGERVSNNTRREFMHALEIASVYFDIDDRKFHISDADRNAVRIFGNLRDEMYSAIA